MPRLPVDGKKVVEHRISLGTFERNLLQDIATSYRVQAIDPEAMFKILEDPLRIVQIAYGIATTLELIGFETGLPTPGDIPELYQWFDQRAKEVGETKFNITTTIANALKKLLDSDLPLDDLVF